MLKVAINRFYILYKINKSNINISDKLSNNIKSDFKIIIIKGNLNIKCNLNIMNNLNLLRSN